MSLLELFGLRYTNGIVKTAKVFNIEDKIIYSYTVEYTYKNKKYISQTIHSNNKNMYNVDDKVSIKIIDKKCRLVKILSRIEEY